jgi:microcystin-dependent protein
VDYRPAGNLPVKKLDSEGESIMAETFLGSLLCVPYNFAPKDWAFCSGQLMSISQNTALFSLLGTTYGGDGRVTFALPNLAGCVPIGQGQGPGLQDYSMGQIAGSPTVTLTSAETPPHTHTVMSAKISANQTSPTSNGIAPTTAPLPYSSSVQNLTAMSPQSITPIGSNGPHNNMMPYTALNWVICLSGLFPARQ